MRCRNFSGKLKNSMYGYVRHGKDRGAGTQRLASGHVVIGQEQVAISGDKSQHLQSTKSSADKSLLSTESWGLLCWVRGHGKELQKKPCKFAFLDNPCLKQTRGNCPHRDSSTKSLYMNLKCFWECLNTDDFKQ